MRVVAIIQARMDSEPLPGKPLKLLSGRPALWHVLDRVSRCRLLDEVVVATSTAPDDDPLADFCLKERRSCFRGSPEDVLDRYYQAARRFEADVVVRLTADCPVLDPEVVDSLIRFFMKTGCDYCSTDGEIPLGQECEAFSFQALEVGWRESRLPSHRRHVTPYLTSSRKFRICRHSRFQIGGQLRLLLDEPADLEFLRSVFRRLYRPGEIIRNSQIVDLLEREPELSRINSHIPRRRKAQDSKEEDRRFLMRERFARMICL